MCVNIKILLTLNSYRINMILLNGERNGWEKHGYEKLEIVSMGHVNFCFRRLFGF
jgi:hypothetical protein